LALNRMVKEQDTFVQLLVSDRPAIPAFVESLCHAASAKERSCEPFDEEASSTPSTEMVTVEEEPETDPAPVVTRRRSP
jgi:hypothetical protein